MPRDVTVHLLHVRKVVLGQVRDLLALDLDNTAAGEMADAFARATAVLALESNGAAFLGRKPLLQFRCGHVHRFVEILADLVAIKLGHVPQTHEWAAGLNLPERPNWQAGSTRRP
jgi:hypothetical protein